MSHSEELAVLTDDNLVDFLLKYEATYPQIPAEENPEMPAEENGLLENLTLPEPDLLDMEIDDFFSFLLSSCEGELDMLQDYLPADSDNSVSEDQHLFRSPGNGFATRPSSSDVIKDEHSYSLHGNWPVLESMRSETSEQDVSNDLGAWMGLEGTSKALEQSSSLPVAVDARPQLVPGSVTQSNFQELILKEKERQVPEKTGCSLPSRLQQTKTEDHLLKKVRRNIKTKRSAQRSRGRKRMYRKDLKKWVTLCTAQYHRLERKVQRLQKQNMSVLKQLRKLWALVRRSTAEAAAAKAYTMVMVLSLYLIVFPNSCSLENGETQLELGELLQQIHEFVNQVAPDVQEYTILEGFSLEPEDASLLGSLNLSQEEGQSPPNPNPRSFNSNLSSSTLVAVISEPGPPQPQEQHSQSDPLLAAVLAMWEARRQEWVQGAAEVVIQQQHADGL
ncbi:PREDICTED: cyclic AMP-responsive element-binding protein 3-like protein 3 [Tauraco erythrolophus]|uniref:cyclic AMP-responsive element-binding protein 3-like protein 3 n=1 Tax=Tauraco erythrolophus TaxID=121530 RepID=UPI000523BB42|nr:PREDICTED: cyclic AMP-responsive element-binding protein 3-like protein 3 [Tauraco erythrolophus]